MSTPDIDADLTARANDLLREDPRLLAAAPLIGKVAVLYREPKPEAEEKADKPAKRAKKPPMRVNGASPVGEVEVMGGESGEVTEAPPGPPATPSPWHTVAVLSKADSLAKFKPDTFAESSEWASLNGGPILAKVIVDGTLWEKLNGTAQRAALVHALRGLRHKARASDSADLAVVEKPPIRCWPDTAYESQELMASLGPDGAEGAALIGALASSDIVENLEEAVAKVKRLVDAGQDMSGIRDDLRDAEQRLVYLINAIDEQTAQVAA